MTQLVKNMPVDEGDARDPGSILGSGRSSRGGHNNPLQYSCLESPMYRRAWWATVHGVTKSQTRQCVHVCMRAHTHTHTHTCNELVLLLSADLFVLTPFPIVNSVYIFSNVYLTVQREVAVSSQVFHVACNFSRSDVFVKQQTLYKVDYSVSPNIDIQEASIKERKRKKNVTKF